MFALMALAGDVGCSAGPTLVGMVSGVMGDNLKMGILAGTVFPLPVAHRASGQQNRSKTKIPEQAQKRRIYKAVINKFEAGTNRWFVPKNS